MLSSIEAFKCGDFARYLETKLNPAVYPRHLGKFPAPKNMRYGRSLRDASSHV